MFRSLRSLRLSRLALAVAEVKASHAVMVSTPGPTTTVILAAIKGVS
ncbi:hypothetical protein O7608_25930 [Solwaraspora sp. WMMA2056]|nr:hypothetical protein [Solwaraspora sp. WMMA2056]WJK39848.1 hypothetical protein O7608_25930 [Solwaraspora sp. WMMA2056]